MKESGKERFILTKSYEVAYALFRLAAPLKEADFSEKLRSVGADLLSAAAEEDYGAAERAVQVAECLVKFGGDVNLIGASNTGVTLRELYALGIAVAERKNAAKTDEVNVAEIFSKPQIEKPAESGNKKNESGNGIRQSGNAAMTQTNPAMESGNPATQEPAIAGLTNEAAIESAIEPTIRQSAILDLIRQTGNCRVKEIQEFLPDTSERTLRYDLQTLVERNLIEKVGSGGPSVFYRMVSESAAAENGA